MVAGCAEPPPPTVEPTSNLSSVVIQRIRDINSEYAKGACNLRIHETYVQGLTQAGVLDGVGYFETHVDRGDLELAAGERVWSRTRRQGEDLYEYSTTANQWRAVSVVGGTSNQSPLTAAPGIDALQVRDVYGALLAGAATASGHVATVLSGTGAPQTKYVITIPMATLGASPNTSDQRSWEEYVQAGVSTLEVSVSEPLNGDALVSFDLPVLRGNTVRSETVKIESACRWVSPRPTQSPLPSIVKSGA